MGLHYKHWRQFISEGNQQSGRAVQRTHYSSLSVKLKSWLLSFEWRRQIETALSTSVELRQRTWTVLGSFELQSLRTYLGHYTSYRASVILVNWDVCTEPKGIRIDNSHYSHSLFTLLLFGKMTEVSAAVPDYGAASLLKLWDYSTHPPWHENNQTKFCCWNPRTVKSDK